MKSIKLWMIAIGFLALIAYGSAFLWGRGGRGYFSPDTLDYQTQSEYLLPLVGIPLYRSGFSTHRNELVQFLVDNNYWLPQPTDSPRWMLAFHWNQKWRDGESGLHKELTRGKDFWIEWSKSNKERATEFWPEVLAMLRNSDDDTSAMETIIDMKLSSRD
jgi:hypothetical protein